MSDSHDPAATPPPRRTTQIARTAAKHVATDIARRTVARTLGGRIVTAAAGKTAVVAGAPIMLVILAIGAVLLLVFGCTLLTGLMGAMQQTTAPWPVPVATRTDGSYRAGGWSVSSPFGWRTDPNTGQIAFHDGIDLVGPTFCKGCGIPAMFDGKVSFVGFDPLVSGDPLTTGGGQLVEMTNGDGDFITRYAHLEPYRLYIRLEGKIADDYGRYPDYADYQAVGSGPLTPADSGAVTVACPVVAGQPAPRFVTEHRNASAITFAYDRPAQGCTATMTWGRKGDGWRGWEPDGPITLAWSTPIETGVRADDVGLRFRAHLVPPPPPPPVTPTLTLDPGGVPPIGPNTAHLNPAPQSTAAIAARVAATPPAATTDSVSTRAGSSGACVVAGGRQVCTFALAALPLLPLSVRDTVAPSGGQGGPARVVQQTAPIITLRTDTTAILRGGIAYVHLALRGTVGVSMTLSMPLTSAPWTTSLVDNSGQLHCITTADAVRCTPSPGAPPGPVALGFIVELASNASPDSRTVIDPWLDLDGQIVRAAAPLVLTVAAPLPPTETPLPTVTQAPTLVTTATAPPSPTPTLPPSGAGPGASPTPPTAPCWRAAVAALSVQGALYSQGGALPDDPRDASGAPLPRTGPRSFDCSGLIWWAYAQAGIAVGTVTTAQIQDGVALPCTLDQMRGAQTTCWAPGDIIISSEHVAIYVGNGLTMDCYNHRVGCILHDINLDAWYHTKTWQARRIVGGCEGLTIDPGAPLPGNLPGPGDTPAADSPWVCRRMSPSFRTAVTTAPGCGPPVRVGDPTQQLTTVLGYIGLTGATTGPHLHLGLRIRDADGQERTSQICTPDLLQGRTPPAAEPCETRYVDPEAFLPRAFAPITDQGTVIPEGVPAQLPPPDYPDSNISVAPQATAAPYGSYWSPNQETGPYGGGMLGWLQQTSCSLLPNLPWCH